jgi:membrane-bound lytic murein transglycosylase B
VETRLGEYVGSGSILNTLSTMAALSDPQVLEAFWEKVPAERRLERTAFEKKAKQKSGWAYDELKALLKYAKRENLSPETIVGSFAGAMGIAQFMPSNILAYGQDGNGDGRINLYEDADAIYSIAAYLKNYGWKPGIDRKQASKVVYHYNHSKYYVNAILKIADLLEG